MPTYEYVCKSCGHLFEIVQSMRDDPLTECPQCGGELRKVFAAPAISFKGSGFYATDARKSAKRSGDTKDTKEKKTSGTSSESASSETKTEKKGSEKKGSETTTGGSGTSSGSGSSD